MPFKLPPDLLQIEKMINSAILAKVKQHAVIDPIKIQFSNPVEPLDVFFMLNWFVRSGVENINIDFYTSDPILLKKTSEGIFKGTDILEYCQPQNLKIEQPWLKEIAEGIFQVDPRLLLKIQFHWIASLKTLESIEVETKYHFLIKGPVFSDSYEKIPMASTLPCYEVRLSLPI